MLLVLSCGSTVILSCTTLPMTAEAATTKIINKGEVTLTKGKIYQLKAPETKKKITWKSNKPTIVSVNSKGNITAKNLGRATVTAKAGKKKYIYKVTVKAPGIVDAYEGLIRKYGNKDGSYFGCYDFDSDGIKEILIVKTDYSKFGVFDYVNNKIVLMGDGDKIYNGFSISRDGKYLITSNIDLIQLYSITNGRIKPSREYVYPGTFDENSEEYKEWLRAVNLVDKSVTIPAKYYDSVDKATNALYKMFNR